MIQILKNILIEFFYWCWLPFHKLYSLFSRLQKKAKIKCVEKKLRKRKDCVIKIGNQLNIHPSVHILVEPNSSLTIGNKVSVAKNTRIGAKRGGSLVIGNNSYIGRYCIISSWFEVIIEDNVLFSDMIWVADHQHKFDLRTPVDFAECDQLKKIHIKSGVWIGNKVTIMQGVTIGKNSVIGANSVVTKDIPDGCVAVGLPAKIIKSAENMKNEN